MFICTGCICNVAGVVPFNQTGYIRGVSGTAHRPFPTVSLVGVTVHPHRLYLKRCLAMNHRRYIAWFHSSVRVIFGTWRAADCRPYMHVGGCYRSSAQVVFETLLGDESSPLHCVEPFIFTVYIRKVPYGFALYRIPFLERKKIFLKTPLTFPGNVV